VDVKITSSSSIEVWLGKEEDVEIDTPGLVYDDTLCVIEKDTSFHWGEIYQMFTNQTFSQTPEGDPNLGEYKKIKHSKLHMIAAHSTIFPCAEAI
jgi:hypothetical protein